MVRMRSEREKEGRGGLKNYVFFLGGGGEEKKEKKVFFFSRGSKKKKMLSLVLRAKRTNREFMAPNFPKHFTNNYT